MRLVLLSLSAILASAVREAEKLEPVQQDSMRQTASRISPDHYQLLNVSRFASTGEMKRSYHKLAMKYHPDRNFGNEGEAEAKFKDLEAAWAILSDAAKREAYDSSHPEAGTEPYNPCAAVTCPKHASCKKNQLDEPYCKCKRRYTLSKNECLTKLQRTVSTACCMEEATDLH
ncbi:dnaJ [Symbiodinium necroappetens]|uniref:DnaJ protein n=1 Tax=Symbiodinium necroappetens TaxID=1628268 RepID=A0A813A7J9_9DINO|nr:dnaJ [Symbiodinium necroappetens]